MEQRGATATVPRGDNVCYAFQKGHCERGDDCGFRHELPDDKSAQFIEEMIAIEAIEDPSDDEFFVLRCELCRWRINFMTDIVC